MVANPKWGTKRQCQSCGTKFYDLLKNPIVCPSCKTGFDPEALLKSRRVRAVVKPKPVEAPAEKKAKDDPKDIKSDSDSDDDDDSVLADTSDSDSDDDLAEVVVDKKSSDESG